jgi:AraC-like DNA-binding protein
LDGPATAVLQYSEFAPPRDLGDWVEAIAVVTIPAEAPQRTWRIIPDARSRLWLPLTVDALQAFRPATLTLRDVTTPPPGTAIMVRFAPWATRVLDANHAAPVWWIAGAQGWCPPLGKEISVRYRGACDWLRSYLPRERPDARVLEAWRMIIAEPGPALEELSAAVGVSPRTLRRIVHRASGCALRDVRQLERFRMALRALRQDLHLSWTRAALQAGFCDQSHLYRMFVRWSGLSPGTFFSQGHHHLNDVFAGRVSNAVDSVRVIGRGAPVLRSAAPPRFPARDRRRARRSPGG